MKIWKVLVALAAAAAVIPYKVEKDEETETTTVKALMWRVTTSPNPEDGGTQVDVGFNLLPDIPGLLGRDKTEQPADTAADAAPDPEEAGMFDDSVNLADIIPAPDKA